ncbi:MAG: hypothetical protein HY912_07710 [Desulfomonile tiedjei]|uniref:Uncharacterized protein n=1 Tax=Desulfomonile tiedjei TaxID=2358 RepID=A0A9D6V0P0_9BACT|nr:hypothetical protein [Desulfomonile tiedjei]
MFPEPMQIVPFTAKRVNCLGREGVRFVTDRQQAFTYARRVSECGCLNRPVSAAQAFMVLQANHYDPWVTTEHENPCANPQAERTESVIPTEVGTQMNMLLLRLPDADRGDDAGRLCVAPQREYAKFLFCQRQNCSFESASVPGI